MNLVQLSPFLSTICLFATTVAIPVICIYNRIEFASEDARVFVFTLVSVLQTLLSILLACFYLGVSKFTHEMQTHIFMKKTTKWLRYMFVFLTGVAYSFLLGFSMLGWSSEIFIDGTSKRYLYWTYIGLGSNLCLHFIYMINGLPGGGSKWEETGDINAYITNIIPKRTWVIFFGVTIAVAVLPLFLVFLPIESYTAFWTLTIFSIFYTVIHIFAIAYIWKSKHASLLPPLSKNMTGRYVMISVYSGIIFATIMCVEYIPVISMLEQSYYAGSFIAIIIITTCVPFTFNAVAFNRCRKNWKELKRQYRIREVNVEFDIPYESAISPLPQLPELPNACQAE